ncbi:MAG: hypothetical protein ACP5H2_00045 [Solirubrobacteraceae bacterium]
MFVVINLERVNRGLPPIVALASGLDRLAEAGARTDDDPQPPRTFSRAGSIWSSAGSVLLADYGWMYADGYGPGGPFKNVACTEPGSSGCWGHRDIILMQGANLLGGGGRAILHGYASLAFEIASGYSSRIVFTWKHELRFFATPPHNESRWRAG